MLVTKVVANGVGETTIIQGISNKKIRVLAYVVTSAVQNMVKWKSDGTELTGELHMPGGGNIVIHMGDLWPSGGLPALECAIGQSLNIYVDKSGVVGGHITYYYIGA